MIERLKRLGEARQVAKQHGHLKKFRVPTPVHSVKVLCNHYAIQSLFDLIYHRVFTHGPGCFPVHGLPNRYNKKQLP